MQAQVGKHQARAAAAVAPTSLCIPQVSYSPSSSSDAPGRLKALVSPVNSLAKFGIVAATIDGAVVRCFGCGFGSVCAVVDALIDISWIFFGDPYFPFFNLAIIISIVIIIIIIISIIIIIIITPQFPPWPSASFPAYGIFLLFLCGLLALGGISRFVARTILSFVSSFLRVHVAAAE
jgi:hypothetical protein